MVKTDKQAKLAEKKSASHAAYDDVPYVSHAFPQTNPVLLQGIAKIFGLSTVSPDKARILEIGCASGGNILTLANNYPKSKCVGIDYSERQIALGKSEMAAGGITNLELKHMSVMDVTKDFGTFDYIICHGVLSWVAPEVQDKILEVCSANLAEDGVAFVSYNTLPGWNSVRSVRDMMLYHTERFADAPTKASQARLMLKFVGDAMRAKNNPTADFLEREFALLEKQPDAYLLHDHLEENNFPFYFHEVMARAGAKGLQYLADTSLDMMFSGNLPADVAKQLAASDDIVRTEQYMDYITNRRFRNTLLCHKDRILNRNIQPPVLQDGYVISQFSFPEGFENHDIASQQPVEFKTPGGMTLTSNQSLCLALMQVLKETKSAPVSVKDVFARVEEKCLKANIFKPGQDQKIVEEQTGLQILRYIFLGGIAFVLHPFHRVSVVSKKPMISKLVRHQAANQGWVSGGKQESVIIDPLDTKLIPYIDGTHDEAALNALMLPHFTSNEISMNENGQPIGNLAIIQERLANIIPDKLQRYAALGLLEK